jgi:hypothetical protein
MIGAEGAALEHQQLPACQLQHAGGRRRRRSSGSRQAAAGFVRLRRTLFGNHMLFHP